ncbi:MAG: hypothetical protein K2Y21_01850 [Phycisphaerales bacterium]|nr:hypothetical protein [Phycisphaerales bacterium]
MQDPLRLQASLLRRIIKQRPSFDEGLTFALAETTRRSDKRWAACRKTRRVLRDLPDRWASWFDALTRSWPPPEPTEMLWFEFPSELNPALSSVSGYASLDRTDDMFGMDEGRHWPETSDGLTRPEGLLKLPELDAFLQSSGWRRDQFDDDRKSLEPGYHALASVVVTLLVLNCLPKTAYASNAPSQIGVLGGYADGDGVPFGLLTDRRWTPLRYRPSASARKEELDPSSWRFNLKKFLAAGGDPNRKVARGGGTLLHKYSYSDTETIRLILRAGGDPRVPFRKNCPTLFLYSAAELPVLRALVAAGANPKQRSGRGHTLLEWISGDGRCTVQHLDWYWRQGVRFRRESKGFYPLHILGQGNNYERERLARLFAMAKWWVARGFGINVKDKKRLTPLGHAVVCHATELDDAIARRRRDPGVSGHWYYEHDRVAAELLKLGADPNVTLPRTKSRRVPRGGTPLMVRRYDSPLLVESLLKHGADPTLRCARGRTALDYARRAAKRSDQPGNEAAPKVVELLERAMNRMLGRRGKA